MDTTPLPGSIALLRLLRFRQWYYFLALPLAGADVDSEPLHNALAIARGIAIAFCVLGFGYLVNAAADVDGDVDARKNPLIVVGAPPRVRTLATALAIVALALAAAGPPVVLVATLVPLVSGLVYSVGPRLKGVPVIGTLMNATNFVPLLWVGAARFDPPLAKHLALAFAGLLLQSQIIHEAADAEGDARAGVRTTFVALESRGSALLAAIFGALPVLGLAAGAFARAFLAATYVLVFPLAFAVVGKDPARAARLRTWHRVSGLALGAALFLHEARG
jgi:4-hydroxybenzoate polyprenyltransferase